MRSNHRQLRASATVWIFLLSPPLPVLSQDLLAPNPAETFPPSSCVSASVRRGLRKATVATPASYAQYTHVVLHSRWFICNQNGAISTSSVKHIYRSRLVEWSPSCPATSFPFYFAFFHFVPSPSSVGLLNPLSRHCSCVWSAVPLYT